MIHAHVETYSTDCDGPLSGGFVMVPTDDDLTSDFADIEFHHRVVSYVVNSYSLMAGGNLRVSRCDDGRTILVWTEATEEGGRRIDATICNDEGCDLGEEPWQRDHRAESMGY